MGIFTSKTRKSRNRPSNTPRVRLGLEQLEDRTMLSIIVWTNRSAFDDEFGANTAAARTVIDQVILDWSTVIEDFRFANVGSKGWAPHTYYELEVFVKDWQKEPDNPNTLARGGYTEIDDSIKPYKGQLTLDDDANKGSWYFDPIPGDDFEFPKPVAPFAAIGGPAGSDLYSVALHEVGHALGFQATPLVTNLPVLQNGTINVITLADGSTATLNPDRAHTDAVRHPNDLMNPSVGSGERRTISDLDARILGKAFGYAINLGVTHQRSFITTFDVASRTLTFQGDLGTAYDDIRFDILPGGDIFANVNGRIKKFYLGAVRSIVVLGGSGNDDIFIGATVAGQPLTINAGPGNNYVFLSHSALNLNTIQGDVTVFEQGGRTNVNFLDEKNTVVRSFLVSHSDVTFSGSNARVKYFYSNVSSDVYALILRGGSGGNTYTIRNDFSPTIIKVRAGTGSDTVNVKETAAGSSLHVDGVAGSDRVTIGTTDDRGVSNIKGLVYVSNSNSYTDLVIDDSFSTAARLNVRISDTEIIGLAPDRIIFDPRGIRSLTVKASTEILRALGNTITVLNTPQNRANNLLVDLSTGRNADTVNVVRTSSSLFINGERGLDTVNIGFTGRMQNRLQSVAGTVTVTNVGGYSAVNVNNSADTVARTMILYYNGYYNVISGLGSADILLRGRELSSLTIRPGNGGNTIRIHDTPASNTPGGLTTTIHTGQGSDQVTVNGISGALALNAQGGTNSITIGSATTGLNAINGPIYVSGPGGLNTLNVLDGASTTGHEYLVDLDFVQRLDKARIGYQNLASMKLEAGTGTDTVNVLRIQNSVTIDGRGGGDTVNVGLDGDMQGILGKLTVQNLGPSSRTLHLNNWADASFRNVTLSFVDPRFPFYIIAGLAPSNIWFQDIGSLAITTGDGGSHFTFDVKSLLLPLEVSLTAGSGHDTIDVVRYRGNLRIDAGGGLNDIVLGSERYGLDRVRGLVTIVAGAGTDALTVVDTPNLDGRRFSISDTMTSLTDKPDSNASRVLASYAGLAAYSLRAGAGNDVISLEATPGVSGTIDGGGGVSTLDYSEYTVGSDDNYVIVPNAPSLEPTTVSVETWVNSWIGDQHNRYILAKGAANGDTAASYALYTGASGGLFFYVYDGDLNYVESPDAGIEIWDNTWHHVVGTYDGETVRLFVDGAEVGSGTPTTIPIGYGLPDSNDLYVGAYPGPSLLSFVGRVDEPSIYNRALNASEVQSLFTSGNSALANDGVTVNLQIGTATGLPGGIANIQNVIGSAGNDILVGNGGNVLSGGAGRDLLIGGAFASILNGGSGDDILIGGTTNYDNGQAALQAIMAEWSSAADYATRVANFQNGTGGVPILNDTTVHSNGGGNTLDGNAGLDLLFANMDDLDTLYADPLTEEIVSV